MSAEIVNINTNKVPPKTFRVRHKGLHGTITYNPTTKEWDWVVNMLVKVPQSGHEPTEDKAKETLKRILDTAAVSGSNVTTTD